MTWREDYRWYTNPGVVVLSLFLCFPIGITLIWLTKWMTKTKVIITAVTLLVAVGFGIINLSEDDDPATAPATTAPLATTTTTSAVPSTPPTTAQAPCLYPSQ